MQIKRTDIFSPEYDRVLSLRDRVLRAPIGLSIKDDDLNVDAEDVILVAMDAAKVIGCLLLHPKGPKTFKLRQMAVAPAWQGKGIGRELMAAAEEIAWSEGCERIELHAREVAAGFYEKMGYRQKGDPFTEVGIPHVLMQKDKE